MLVTATIPTHLGRSLLNQEVGWVCGAIPETHGFSLTTSEAHDQFSLFANFLTVTVPGLGGGTIRFGGTS